MISSTAFFTTTRTAFPGRHFRPNAPLLFANADKILGNIAQACAGHPTATVIILNLEENDDLESSALEALGESASNWRQNALPLRLARAHDRVRVELENLFH